MALNWPTFFKRLGSAIVFSAIMMTGLLWKDWMFALLVVLIMVLCLREYFRLSNTIAATERNHSLELITLATALGFAGLFALPFLGITVDKPLWPLLLCLPVTLIMWGHSHPGTTGRRRCMQQALCYTLYCPVSCSWGCGRCTGCSR